MHTRCTREKPISHARPVRIARSAIIWNRFVSVGVDDVVVTHFETRGNHNIYMLSGYVPVLRSQIPDNVMIPEYPESIRRGVTIPTNMLRNGRINSTPLLKQQPHQYVLLTAIKNVRLTARTSPHVSV